ncbi:MAG: tetratricopeptide (TPR) repeat protein [Glaciecola sp.]
MNKSIVIVLFAVLIFSCKSGEKSKSHTSGKENPDKVLEGDALVIEAQNQKNKGNLREALNLYYSALKKQGSTAAIHYEIAQLVYELDKDYEEAAKHIAISLEEDNTNKWYLFFYLKINEENRKSSEIEKGFVMLLNAFPNNTSYIVDFADFYISQQKYEKALTLYGEVENKLGVTESINKNKFLIYKGLKKDDLAILELEKLIKAFPVNERYYMELVDMYRLQKKHDKVQEIYELALKKMPDNSAVKDEYAHNCFLNNKIDTAFDFHEQVIKDKLYKLEYKLEIISLYVKYEKFDSTLTKKREVLQQIAHNIHGEEYQYNKFMGELNYRKREYANARSNFKKALSSSQNNYGTWQQLIICDNELENYQLMAADALEALSFFPAQADLYYYYGIASVQLKNDENAIKYFEQGLELSKDKRQKTGMYSALGDSYYSLNNKVKAFKNYDAALELDSLNALVLNNYAYYLSVEGNQLVKAEEMSNMSNVLSPKTASFNDTYGWILYQMGRYDLALEWLLKAELNGGDESGVIMDHIGDSYFKLQQSNRALTYWKKAIKLGADQKSIQTKIDQL